MTVEFLETAKTAALLAGCCLIGTVAAALIDLWTGCDCARRRGEKIASSKLRRTVAKLGDYWRVQALGIVGDALLIPFFDWPYLTVIITLGIVLIEFKSVIENLRSVKSEAAGSVDTASEFLRLLTSRDISRLKDLLNKDDKKR